MYHLPKFFNHTSSPKRNNKLKRSIKGGPKLQRLNAQKGIDYTPRETQSLDLDTTSFRIQGAEGELDRVYQSLGLSGPDDLGISILDWEARKNNPTCFSEVKSLDLDCCENRVSQIVDSFSHVVRFSSHVDDCNDRIQSQNEIQHVYVGKGNGGRNGIKGVRPPVLIPPVDGVPYSIPMYDMKLFVPEVEVDVDDDEDNGVIGGGRGIKGVRPPGLVTPPDTMRYNVPSYASDSYGLEDSGGDVEDEGDNEEFGENESCSFTTNDDDSSSTTTENISPTVRTRSIDGSSVRNEPPSYISPNGRVRRIVNNWTKGRLLGRGSFGSVYEGIAE